jgi:predicted nucleic acid-binding protein
MSWLLDTNLLLRLADAQSPEHDVAEAAIEQLIAREETVFITFQVLVEFWAVATRPEEANGLGWPAAATSEAIRWLRDQFPMLNETPDVLDRWLELAGQFQVSGKHTHDARLAALHLVHGIGHLLTFNTSDFPRAWGVEAMSPFRFQQA